MKISVKTLDNLLTIKIFLIVNSLILVAKVFYSFDFNFPGESFEDFRIAQNLRQNGIYAEYMAIGPTAYKLPLYPLFLSFFIWLTGDYAKEFIVLSQHLIFFFVPILIISLFRIFQKEKHGLIAAYIFIFSPAYFFYSNVIEVTNLFVPIFLLWIYFFLKVYVGSLGEFGLLFFGFLTALLFLT